MRAVALRSTNNCVTRNRKAKVYLRFYSARLHFLVRLQNDCETNLAKVLRFYAYLSDDNRSFVRKMTEAAETSTEISIVDIAAEDGNEKTKNGNSTLQRSCVLLTRCMLRQASLSSFPSSCIFTTAMNGRISFLVANLRTGPLDFGRSCRNFCYLHVRSDQVASCCAGVQPMYEFVNSHVPGNSARRSSSR